jgi:hypothetical protein
VVDDATRRLAREAAVARRALRRRDDGDGDALRLLRRYDGVLARLAEAAGVDRPPLTDRSPAGRNRRRAEIERLLADAGIDLRGG